MSIGGIAGRTRKGGAKGETGRCRGEKGDRGSGGGRFAFCGEGRILRGLLILGGVCRPLSRFFCSLC